MDKEPRGSGNRRSLDVATARNIRGMYSTVLFFLSESEVFEGMSNVFYSRLNISKVLDSNLDFANMSPSCINSFESPVLADQ